MPSEILLVLHGELLGENDHPDLPDLPIRLRGDLPRPQALSSAGFGIDFPDRTERSESVAPPSELGLTSCFVPVRNALLSSNSPEVTR